VLPHTILHHAIAQTVAYIQQLWLWLWTVLVASRAVINICIWSAELEKYQVLFCFYNLSIVSCSKYNTFLHVDGHLLSSVCWNCCHLQDQGLKTGLYMTQLSVCISTFSSELWMRSSLRNILFWIYQVEDKI
jgi:hypothetical protein